MVWMLLCCLFAILPLPTLQFDTSQAVAFLQKYGYVAWNPSREALSRAIMNYQAFVGLHTTGYLDSQTIQQMTRPRCGVKDKFIRRKRYAVLGFKWRYGDLTYKVTKYSHKIYWGTVEETIKRAFSYWSRVTPLSFEKIDYGEPDIQVRFEEGDHGDGQPMDGPGNLLAHAFSPMAGGDIHFDDSEYWNYQNGPVFLHTATHEVGHSLGLEHTNVWNAVMHPYTNLPRRERVDMTRDDLRGIQAIYGRRINRGKRSVRFDSALCRQPAVDAAFNNQNGDVFIFKGEDYWMLGANGIVSGYPKKIGDTWEGMQGDVDAVFTKDQKTFFFKGGQYWSFNGTKMEDGYPKRISDTFPDIPDHLDAAMAIGKPEEIYFFKGSQFWILHKQRKAHSITEWRGIPNNLDAVFAHPNGHLYFFKDNLYYKVGTSKLVEKGYPKLIKYSWYGCR